MPRKKTNRGRKRAVRKMYGNAARNQLSSDFPSTRPVGGKFLKIGDHEIILTKTKRRDADGNAVYVGTIVKRRGLLKGKVPKASHVWINPV